MRCYPHRHNTINCERGNLETAWPISDLKSRDYPLEGLIKAGARRVIKNCAGHLKSACCRFRHANAADMVHGINLKNGHFRSWPLREVRRSAAKMRTTDDWNLCATALADPFRKFVMTRIYAKMRSLDIS